MCVVCVVCVCVCVKAYPSVPQKGMVMMNPRTIGGRGGAWSDEEWSLLAVGRVVGRVVY